MAPLTAVRRSTILIVATEMLIGGSAKITQMKEHHQDLRAQAHAANALSLIHACRILAGK